jgi:beta-phosphoglucomutase-like phosphatase (HAD superfamily)
VINNLELSKNLQKAALLVVDLDGTLIDSEPLHHQAYELLISLLLGRDVSIEFDRFIGTPGSVIWPTLLDEFQLQDVATNRLIELRGHVFLGLLTAAPDVTNWTLVRALRGVAQPVVLLTSQEKEVAGAVLRLIGLDDVVRSIVSVHGGDGWPDKVQAVRRLRQGHAGSVLWFEDAPGATQSAKEAGATLILIPRPYNAQDQVTADLLWTP